MAPTRQNRANRLATDALRTWGPDSMTAPQAPCPQCAQAERNPECGALRAQCPHCQARELALSPIFYATNKAGAITPAYRARLVRIYGNDGWKAGHARVKSIAEHFAAHRVAKRQPKESQP
jgi:hypothetical protein